MALVLQSLDIKDSICSWWIPLFSQYYNETLPGGGNYSTFINSEALSHFNLLKKEQMFLVQQLLP